MTRSLFYESFFISRTESGVVPQHHPRPWPPAWSPSSKRIAAPTASSRIGRRQDQASGALGPCLLDHLDRIPSLLHARYPPSLLRAVRQDLDALALAIVIFHHYGVLRWADYRDHFILSVR